MTTLRTHRLGLTRFFCTLSFIGLHLRCKEPSGPFTEGYLGSLPPIDIPWYEGQSIVCFGTSLTYGFGAGERSPYCKEEPISLKTHGRTFIEYATSEIIRLTGEHEERVLALRGQAHRIGSACEGDSSYPRFLQEFLRMPVLNQGYVAATTSTGLDVVDDSVLSKKPALVLLEFAANDFLRDRDVHTTDSLLGVLVNRIRLSGATVVFVSFIHPDMAQYTGTDFWTTEDSIRAIDYYEMITGLGKRLSLPIIEYPLRAVFGRTEMMSDRFHPNGAGYKRMSENIMAAMYLTFKNNGMLK